MATPTRQHEGQPNGHAPGVPSPDRRFRVYILLKLSGTEGITHREIAEYGIHRALAHVESLQLEGHGIEVLMGEDETGLPVRRFFLRRDIWADA